MNTFLPQYVALAHMWSQRIQVLFFGNFFRNRETFSPASVLDPREGDGEEDDRISSPSYSFAFAGLDTQTWNLARSQ